MKKDRYLSILSIGAILLAGAGMVSCNEGEGELPENLDELLEEYCPEETFTLDGVDVGEASITGLTRMMVGESMTLTLEAAGTYNGGWSSSDTSVATVDSNGVVTGIKGGVATISYRGINEVRDEMILCDKEVRVFDELPDLVTTIENIKDARNYTMFVYKDGVLSSTLKYTEDFITLESHLTDGWFGAHLASDGYVYSIDRAEDGTLSLGERLKDGYGFLNVESFYGRSDPNYYSPVVSLSNLNLTYFINQGTDNVYNLLALRNNSELNVLVDPNSESDMDTMNYYNLYKILDFDVYDYLNRNMNRAYSQTYATATVTGVYGLEIAADAQTYQEYRDQRNSETGVVPHEYELEVVNVGLTDVDSEVRALAGVGVQPEINSDIARAKSLMTGTNFIIDEGFTTQINCTDDYLILNTSDEVILSDYQDAVTYPDYYTFDINDYQTWGYVRVGTNVYYADQQVSLDTSGESPVVSRGAFTIYTDYGSYYTVKESISEAFDYPSNWELWDREEVLSSMVLSSNWKTYGTGYATYNKEVAEEMWTHYNNWDAVNDFSWTGDYRLEPYYLEIDFQSENTSFGNQGVVAEKDEDCVVYLNFYYQAGYLVGKSSAASIAYMSFSSFGAANLTEVESAIAAITPAE